MPNHRPIKFKRTLAPSILDKVENLVQNKYTHSVLNATLAVVAVGGVLTCITLAPGLSAITGRSIKNSRKEKFNEYRRLWHNYNKLKRQGDLKFTETKGGYDVYSLTSKGERKISKFILEETQIPIPKRWDKKWRMVIFDIPESRRGARTALRRKLDDMGFYQCQKSVWIHPFPCLEEIEFIKDVFKIKAYVKIFTVVEMTDGKTLYYFKDILKKVITD